VFGAAPGDTAAPAHAPPAAPSGDWISKLCHHCHSRAAAGTKMRLCNGCRSVLYSFPQPRMNGTRLKKCARISRWDGRAPGATGRSKVPRALRAGARARA